MELDLKTTGTGLVADLTKAATNPVPPPDPKVGDGIAGVAAALAQIPLNDLIGLKDDDNVEVHISASLEGQWAVVRVGVVKET